MGLHARHLAHLGGLFALRYLSLPGTWIIELPEDIGELKYLQTLDIIKGYWNRDIAVKCCSPSTARGQSILWLCCAIASWVWEHASIGEVGKH
jgi:hypothetical protein